MEMSMQSVMRTVRMMEPNQDGRFQCPHEMCSNTFTIRNNIYQHYKASHLGVKVPCRKCDSSFKDYNAMNKHMKTCNGKKVIYFEKNSEIIRNYF